MKNRVEKNSKNAQRRFCIRIICVYKEGNLCAEMRKRRLLPQRCGAQLRPKDAGLFTPGGRDYPRTECAGNVSTPLSFSYEKESAVDGRKKEYQRGICVGTNFTFLAPPQAAGLVRFVVPPFPARTASLGSRGSLFFGIPLKRPRRGCCPFLDFPRSLVCAKRIPNQKNAMQMRIGIDRRGSRNTLRLFRLPYVKYSTGANITKSI